MGWINDGMANEAARCARKAVEDGERVLVYKFLEASGGSRLTGPMSGIGGQIEAVEAEGWQLATMTAAEGKSLTGQRVALVCLFRRA
jgi:hypothetical protein